MAPVRDTDPWTIRNNRGIFEKKKKQGHSSLFVSYLFFILS